MMGGWYRLWIVYCIVCAVSLISMGYLGFPSSNGISGNDVLKSMSAEDKNYINNAWNSNNENKTASFLGYEHNIDIKNSFLETVNDSHGFSIELAIPEKKSSQDDYKNMSINERLLNGQTELESKFMSSKQKEEKYSDISEKIISNFDKSLERILFDKRLDVIAYLFGYWIALILYPFAIGHGIRWIYRGFKGNKNGPNKVSI